MIHTGTQWIDWTISPPICRTIGTPMQINSFAHHVRCISPLEPIEYDAWIDVCAFTAVFFASLGRVVGLRCGGLEELMRLNHFWLRRTIWASTIVGCAAHTHLDLAHSCLLYWDFPITKKNVTTISQNVFLNTAEPIHKVFFIVSQNNENKLQINANITNQICRILSRKPKIFKYY